MTWEVNCEKNISEIMNLVQAVVSSCQEGLDNLPQLLIKFNFLIGTNQHLDLPPTSAAPSAAAPTADLDEFTEEEMTSFFYLPSYNHPPQSGRAGGEAPWDFVEKQLLPMIEILIQGGEEAGSITTQGLLIHACQKVFHWIAFVKSKLTSGDWGNVSR
jgi:hypothetical protein